ncbi:tail sheath protein [Escherichia coli]|uniref:Tail sheath protein n=1 Tax=Escherichia coli TaxID=562 RepID=A0A2X1LBY5_ECOLX|nr:tail sheath protein [Escherichia coli]
MRALIRFQLLLMGPFTIDDSLTTYSKNNYLRFQHVSSLMNAIARDFYEVAQAIKHEPDGITKETLMKAMTELLDRYVAAGALVTPRDKSQGEDPYVVQVVQRTSICGKCPGLFVRPGTARRIVGKPILMR